MSYVPAAAVVTASVVIRTFLLLFFCRPRYARACWRKCSRYSDSRVLPAFLDVLALRRAHVITPECYRVYVRGVEARWRGWTRAVRTYVLHGSLRDAPATSQRACHAQETQVGSARRRGHGRSGLESTYTRILLYHSVAYTPSTLVL